MKRILLISFMLMSALISEAWAQRAVTGQVVSGTDGGGLPGVSVRAKGTSTGVTTDLNGNYRLQVPEGVSTLVFSFVGFNEQEVQIGNRSVVDVTLEEDVKQLQEVVVVGYGEVDKRKLTSSISSVGGEEIAQKPIASFDQGLVGRASGVQVTIPSGVLGQAPRIRVRGTNSITSGAEPLVVIDGVPMIQGNQSAVAPNNALGDINPADIESYEILKDGAATAIYGSRATNGVILITTKSGKAGRVNVTYNNFLGVNQVASRFNVLNADEFIAISNEKFATSGQAQPQALPGPGNVDTDWQDAIYRNGFMQNHNLSISGGSKDAKYFLSAGFMDQEGAIVRNSLQRATVRANVDYTGVKWLDAGVKFSVARQLNDGLNTGANSLSGNVFAATKLFPNVPIYDEEHPTGYNLSSNNAVLGAGNNLQNIAFNLPNLQYVLDHNIQQAVNMRTITNGYAQLNILPGLKARTQFGVDIVDNQDFMSWNPVHGDGRGPNGYVYRGSYQVFRWNWQNTLSYNTTLAGVHGINLVVGTEYQKTSVDQFSAVGTDFSDPFFQQRGLISGTYGTQESGGDIVDRGFDSYFGRINYDYDNRYLVSFSLRNDAISDLPVENRQGTFMGASAGWNIAEENFFNVEPISVFKLRASYAETGNVNIPAFSYLGTYGPELYGGQTAIRFENVGNSDLRWETSTKLSAGLDFGLFNNRVSGSLDWYQNNVDDLILAAPTPPSFGLPGNSISQNVGSMVNSGIELGISTLNIERGDFTWATNFNIATNRNEILALNNDEDIVFDYTINRVGESISSLYGFQYEGVNPANGNPLYMRPDGTVIQGNPDNNTYYIYDPANPGDLSESTTALGQSDKVILGQTNPKFFGGIGNTVNYKGFDFELFLTFAGGNYIMNATRQGGMAQEFSNNFKQILNRWTPENTNTDVPRLSYANSNFLNTDNQTSSRFVEKGDFLRAQNITLGYTFSRAAFQSIGVESVQRLRIYAQAQNAFVLTNYSGLDPELNETYLTNRATNGAFGVDRNTNPMMRTFTVGLSLGL